MSVSKFTSRLSPSKWGLPLLAKELIEQAARRRTYVMRVLYAVLLFTASYLMFHDILRVGAVSPFASLGRGRDMFKVLMALQFAGIYLFMPALASGVLTQEKERNSLMLLFLTRLGPWTIVFEKLLGRLIPMLCYLLLSLPLLAYAYTLGGISTESLWSGVWMLAISALQVGALAVCCSAWFRTTVGAFVWTYLFGAALFLGPVVVWMLLFNGPIALSNSSLVRLLIAMGLIESGVQSMSPFFAPVHFFGGQSATGGFSKTLLGSVPILFSTCVFLVLARVFVVRRAFVPPRNLVLGFFKLLDGVFAKLNQNRVTRGIVLIGDKSSLPEKHPVAWRETTKRSLGRARYLFRIFIAIEAPLAAVCILIATFGADSRLEGVSLMLFLLWIVAVLMISVQAACLISGERTHQTLDVLTTTPLTGRDILLQKFRGVQRLMIVLMIPFFSIFLFETLWKAPFSGSSNSGYGRFDPPLYLICSAVSVGIYLPLVAWLSFLIGLAMKSQARAIVAALGAIVGWCVLPLIFIMLPLAILMRYSGNSPLTYFALLSPASIIAVNEYSEMTTFANAPWLAVVLNFLGYGAMLALIRSACLGNADWFLGRADSKSD
ncbi:MAG: hypothetical protein EXS05_00265 [Planctomycetaceae bacterium]|nr:hypothetical protein [Planctomycetaceae bacterium]